MFISKFNSRHVSIRAMEKSQATEKFPQEHSMQFTLLPTCREGAGVAAVIWEEFVFC